MKAPPATRPSNTGTEDLIKRMKSGIPKVSGPPTSGTPGDNIEPKLENIEIPSVVLRK